MQSTAQEAVQEAVRQTDRRHLYVQVRDRVEAFLRKGHYRPGDRLPTNRELARRMDVSALTVQKAMRMLTERGALYARRGKGTFVRDLSAAPGPRQKTGHYACMVPSIQANTVSAIVYALDEIIFGTSGRHMFLCNSRLDLDREITLLDSLLDRPIDALIYQLNPLLHIRPAFLAAVDARLQKFLSAGVPVIMIDRFVKADRYDTVEPDKDKMAELMVRHLLDLGHRRLLFVSYRDICRTIVEGWTKAVARNGMRRDRVRFVFVDPAEDPESGTAKELEDVLNEGWAFTAIAAGTDAFALASFRYLKTRGITCPGDVSIIGADNLEFIEHMETPLTTVWSPAQEIAQQVGKLLDARLKQTRIVGAPVRRIEVPPQIIVRTSTAPPLTRLSVGRTGLPEYSVLDRKGGAV